jgi:hypothetical protein
MKYNCIQAMGISVFDDESMARLIRAGFHATVELSGTNIGERPQAFAQVLMVLKSIRSGRWENRPMRMIGLKATGLNDTHFFQIIDAVSQLGQRIEGRGPERLELLDVSALRSIDTAGVLSRILLVWQMLIREDTLCNLTTVCKASGLDLRLTPPKVLDLTSFCRAPQ